MLEKRLAFLLLLVCALLPPHGSCRVASSPTPSSLCTSTTSATAVCNTELSAVSDTEDTTVSNGESTTASDNEDAYSIASVVYNSDNCFSCYTFELDDCWSVLSTEYSYSDVRLCDSNDGDDDESDSISTVSCSSNVSVLSGEVHPDKAYFRSLSACERSTLDSALRVLLLWDSSAKLLREQHSMLYRVILVAFNRQKLGELATPNTGWLR